ncbi:MULTISPECIES: DUF2924 domain-containing protein [Ralstonia]|uniref:DUF2924 domain-containing protein n=1 Tax=Ralstonia TaxID=48736 RepID=UPI0039867FBB
MRNAGHRGCRRDRDLSELMAMDRTVLAERWRQVFGHPAPAKCRAEFLRQALGWQMQADIHGGLSAVDRRRLLRGTSSAAPEAGDGLTPDPGLAGRDASGHCAGGWVTDHRFLDLSNCNCN